MGRKSSSIATTPIVKRVGLLLLVLLIALLQLIWQPEHYWSRHAQHKLQAQSKQRKQRSTSELQQSQELHRSMESSLGEKPIDPSPATDDGHGDDVDIDNPIVYTLQKKHDGCTGMFWRPDPLNGTIKLRDNKQDWPRDGASLKGRVLPTIVDGTRWLAATHVKNLQDKDWKKAPPGAHLPFEYDNHYYLQIYQGPV